MLITKFRESMSLTEEPSFGPVSYRTMRERFDTGGFLKILPLIWTCLLVVFAAIGAELSYWLSYEVQLQARALLGTVRPGRISES